jgi:hypothetical protein
MISIGTPSWQMGNLGGTGSGSSFYSGWSFRYSEVDYGGFEIIADSSTPSPFVSLVLRIGFSPRLALTCG